MPAVFNPIEAAQSIADSYRDYIASTIHFDDVGLQKQLNSILAEEGFLAKGPYLQVTPPYVKDKTVRDLVGEGLLCEGMLSLGGEDAHRFDPDRRLYRHQVRAIRKAKQGRNYVVVTGTGSGKTECFLLPIINDILEEFERSGFQPGTRAILLYPMNALANDQLKRLRELLVGTQITFGRYTGDTKERRAEALKSWREENHLSEPLENEIISREEIRENPPNILLTNYSMLEYLLLRPADAPLFGSVFGKSLRHLAIDEAHVYSGALGTEIAFLIRRLKARIGSETGTLPHPHCYATSATIGTDDDLPLVAKFAQGIFGEPFSSEEDDLDVITSEQDRAEHDLDSRVWGTLPLAVWPRLRDVLSSATGDLEGDLERELLEVLGPVTPEEVLARCFGSEESIRLKVGRLLLGESSTQTIVRRASNELIDLTSIDEIDSLGLEGLGHDRLGIEILTAMVEVLSIAQRSEDVPILSSRYHSFLRAPEGLFINLATRRLMSDKRLSEPTEAGEIPVYEVSVCRHCGQAYILGTEKPGSRKTGATLSPRHVGTDAGDEFLPRTYYRLVPEGEEEDEHETLQWLCPVCGSLHTSREGGRHVFAHEPCDRIAIARDEAAEEGDGIDGRCFHCGYRNPHAIQPMRVSPEAAGAIVCTDLVREVPPFDASPEVSQETSAVSRFARRAARKRSARHRAGSILCFSDRRQDAAFFAPAMDRTYERITHRQLIREAVDARGTDDGCSMSQVIRWITNEAPKLYPGLMGSEDPHDQAAAWVLDELSAEDSRNSLAGLGVVRIEPTSFVAGLADEDVRGLMSDLMDDLDGGRPQWLTLEDYAVLVLACLEDLRSRGAIYDPDDVDDLRTNHGQPVEVVPNGAGEGDRQINFIGTAAGSENKRSRFIRKYAREVKRVEVTREESTEILSSIHQFLAEYIGNMQYLDLADKDMLHGSTERFTLDRDLWRIYPHDGEDRIFVCDTCGCATHLDTHGVCTTDRCEGHLVETTFDAWLDRDLYYKKLYSQEALPLRIEEHTAQLSREAASDIQERFLKGEVNILSCTTTFELGVDVGDLRAIFMRNVPPTVANYTQRAGRVGRRAGKPGYAVTFCRLRPHDIAYFDDPRGMIEGSTPVPACYLDNEQIALRHLFAVAFSEFFRYEGNQGKDLIRSYTSFMNLAQEEPDGLKALAEFLGQRPTQVEEQLSATFADTPRLDSALGISDWSWVDELVGRDDGTDHPYQGRLAKVHQLKHGDYEEVEHAIASADTHGKRGLYRTLEALEKEQTIDVLANTGVLPKYGFPTDLVELHLRENETASGRRLQLQRGLRQAIREYAPGSEIVAGKVVWRSQGIHRSRGQELVVRRYGKCENCDTFIWPIDTGTDTAICPVCESEVTLSKKMLIPSFGFDGARVRKGVGVARPRQRGYVRVEFSQHWPDEPDEQQIDFPGGAVWCKSASNAQLCALNTGSRGFQVCDYCGAAAEAFGTLKHWNYCEKLSSQPHVSYYDALGTDFTSDVLELTFHIADTAAAEPEEWESTMWAIHTAAIQLMQIPASELGCTYYMTSPSVRSILLYDDVPGGAGHTRQLRGMVEEVLNRAYDIVATCSCGEETCCYGCISNYYNQSRQSVLSRGAAKRILGVLLFGYDGEHVHVLDEETPNSDDLLSLTADFGGPNMAGMGFARTCLLALGQCRGDEESRFVRRLAELGEGRGLEVPQIEVTFSDASGNEADAMLAWEAARVALVGRKSIEEFVDAFGGMEGGVKGWTFVNAGSDDPTRVIQELEA